MDHETVTNFIRDHARCLLTAKSIFGGAVTVEIRPIEVKQHGYNCESGGWALYNTDTSDSPAYFLVYKRKSRRKQSTINIDDVDALEPIT
jgi:hypothetical protein